MQLFGLLKELHGTEAVGVLHIVFALLIELLPGGILLYLVGIGERYAEKDKEEEEYRVSHKGIIQGQEVASRPPPAGGCLSNVNI